MTTGAILFLSTLAVLSPKDGSTVATLKDGQKTYLAAARSERFLRMANVAERNKLAAFGAVQSPVKIEWEGPTNAVYTLLVVGKSKAAKGVERSAFAVTNRTAVYLTNLRLDSDYLWKVKSADDETPQSRFSTEPLAPRLLRAEGVGNFRDLGGWKTVDGHRVKEGLVLRSAGLRFSSKTVGSMFRQKVRLGERRITAEGIRTLRDEFHVRTDLELRSERETLGMVSSVLGDDVQWKCVPFVAYDFIGDISRGKMKFAEIFRLFLDEKNYPILFHCSGGRDRTGTLAFLLNGLLGVPEDDLCRDWEFSIFAGQGMSFSPDLIERLLVYVKGLPGATFREKIEAYATGCGITKDEIARFRKIMLD